MTRMLSLLTLLAAVGCSVNKDNWGKKYSKALCKYEHSCAATEFFYNYDNETDCVDTQEKYFDQYADLYATCTFSQSAAQDCLSTLGESCKKIGDEYSSFDPTCGDVWDCSGSADTATP